MAERNLHNVVAMNVEYTIAAVRAEAERLVNAGDPFAAYDVASAGLAHWPGDRRLRQLQALALANSGAPEAAADLLHVLAGEPTEDARMLEETLGMLARTYKDAWAGATDPVRRADYLRRTAAAYGDGYTRTGRYWTGINAATFAALLGEGDRAAAIARAIQADCLDELGRLAPGSPDRYYPLATLGEASLVIGDLVEAEARYAEAGSVGRERLRDLVSTRRNARFLLEHRGDDPHRLDGCFGIPKVALFVGHMVDRPDRSRLRFPAAAEATVAAALRMRLRALDARIGYASAACGGDLLFHEAVLELGGQVGVVLPYERAAFKRDSVVGVGGAGWDHRYERIVEEARRAERLVTLSEQTSMVDPVSYEYANRYLHGLAAIRAVQLETDLVGVALWDGRPGDGSGGTASAVDRWRTLGLQVEIVDLAAITSQAALVANAPASPPPTPATSLIATLDTTDRARPGSRPDESARPAAPPRQIVALLFADTLGYSKLTEQQIPPYLEHFLGGIADLFRQTGAAPTVVDTWGDALYAVFPDVERAGSLALELADWIERQRWADVGLPSELRLRIALHAGPAYKHTDPLSGKRTFSGSQVSRAARLEPVTPPGQVYASEAFAALAAAEGIRDFRCEYVGKTAWAKDHGTFATYHLRRATTA